ncbi:MAG: 5-formyltetrahydrofolate cyclo-ligase [Halobacteriovoraceae bacterium]|nr:5-formyltetrahydrofolate cyclo-ligase [Halobacteriovoraceae bacterium]
MQVCLAMNNAIVDRKIEIRTRAKKYARGLGIEEKKNLDHQITSKLFSLLIEKFAHQNLGVYWPLRDEVDWLRHAQGWQWSGAISFPSFEEKTNTMEFHRLKKEVDLNNPPQLGSNLSFEFRSEVIVPDVLLIPGLSFSESGFRIGRGGGYFDRYLENYSGTTIGICYAKNMVDSFEPESWDRPVNYIINENNTIGVK